MVEKKKVEVEVTKEVYEIGVAIKKLLDVATKALEDGWQPGVDIPSVMLGAYKEVMDAISGLDKVAEEFKQDPNDAVMGMLVPVSEGLEILLERKKAKEIKGAIVGK